MDDMPWSEIIGSLGSTTVAVCFLIYWFLREKPKIDLIKKQEEPKTEMLRQQAAFQGEILKRLATLETINQSLQSRVSALEVENNNLKNKLALMESAHQDLPLPQWLKDDRGIVLACNKAYEDTFLFPLGKTMAHYVGHDDFNVWPKEIAVDFRKNDRQVLDSGEVFNGVEKVLTPNGPEDWHIIKYVRYAGGVKIGIAGIAIPPREVLQEEIE